MLNDLLVVAGSVATLFLLMAVGYYFARRDWLSRETLSQLSRLLLNVVCPCTVINALQVEFSPALLRGMGVALALLVASYVVFGVAVRFLFTRQPGPARAALRFGSMYGNVGFMGLPLIMAVLGQEATIYAAMGIAAFNVATWTHGVTVMGEKASLKRAVLNPGVIGFVIAMILFLGRLALPGPLMSAVESLASLNTPLAMIIIGGQMAGAKLLDTFRERKLYLAAGVKLLVLPAVTMVALLPLGLDTMLYLTLVILAGCPAAGTTSIFCQMFHQDTEMAAKLVSLSTLLSILTLPLITLAARALLG